MSRDIIETVKLAARFFPESPGTVSDVLQVEIKLRAEEFFREGCSVTGAYEAIIKELPETVSAKDKAGILRIVAAAWRQYRFEGGGRG